MCGDFFGCCFGVFAFVCDFGFGGVAFVLISAVGGVLIDDFGVVICLVYLVCGLVVGWLFAF